MLEAEGEMAETGPRLQGWSPSDQWEGNRPAGPDKGREGGPAKKGLSPGLE